MKKARVEGVEAWAKIPADIRKSIRGLSGTDLDRRGGSEGWSIREYVHHVVEANMVASTMVIAALANNGGEFDWTWVNPNEAWMKRVGYDKADVRAALRVLATLCDYIAGIVAAQPGMLERYVRLNDSPGAKRYNATVEKILKDEREHANHHLADIRVTRTTRLTGLASQ
jgi:DinB superfamily